MLSLLPLRSPRFSFAGAMPALTSDATADQSSNAGDSVAAIEGDSAGPVDCSITPDNEPAPHDAPSLPHPPWYRIYSEFTSIAFLTFIALRHAREILIAASFLQQVEREAELPEVLRFENATPADVIDDDSIEGDDEVDESAPLVEHLRLDARRVFRVRSLRPKQEEAITRIVANPECQGKLVVIDRTGGGGKPYPLPHRLRCVRSLAGYSPSPFSHGQPNDSDSGGATEVLHVGGAPPQRPLPFRGER